MEMEKEEQKHMEVVAEDQEQEQEQEETTLLLRKSRTLIDKGISENNGHVVEESLMTENGENNGHVVEESLVNENGDGIEQEIKEVLENGSEAENGEQKSENLVFYDKIEGVEYKTKYSEEKQIENNKHEGHHLESSKEIESAVDDTINEDELEETEYDVEKVVQKQNTHDLFCPNCNSCITRRVILRKRKRRIRVSDEEVKRNKIEAAVVQENFDYARVPTDVDESKEEPDVFRCLSCFSFFIPNGNGLQVPNTKKNWFASLFASTKPETTLEQGVVGTTENNNTLESRDESLPFPRQEPPSNGSVTIGTTEEIGSSNGSPTPENSTEYKEGKLNISGAFPHEEQPVGSYTVTESVVEDTNTNTNFTSSETGLVYSTNVSQHTITNSSSKVHPGKAKDVNSFSSVNGHSVGQGKHTVINIGTRPDESTQIVNATESSSALMSVTQTSETTELRREYGVEIIKSIVYGGLAESITSLSVVSSAAGGNTATLNVLALGMANIIGGLFIICHNLWELRCDRIVQVNNQISNQVIGQRDRYKELLGRRDNFILHVVVSILSYLIFGLVPPTVYGFSFRKSDDKEFKLMVVAAASLLCITMLAIGRAFIQRPPKEYFKCVLNFVILGVMVSGVSYAGGVLIERLLEKLHLFEPSPVSGLLLHEMTQTQTHSAWASN